MIKKQVFVWSMIKYSNPLAYVWDCFRNVSRIQVLVTSCRFHIKILKTKKFDLVYKSQLAFRIVFGATLGAYKTRDISFLTNFKEKKNAKISKTGLISFFQDSNFYISSLFLLFSTCSL